MLHCPNCGLLSFKFDGQKVYHCEKCQYEFFFNAAAAVGALIVKENKLLTAVRAKNPSKGMLDLPGGFVDPGESLEHALIREVQEELSVTLTSLQYFSSGPNQYLYNNIEYTTCDAFFICKADHYEGMHANDDICEFRWIPIKEINFKEFAFHSVQQAIKKLIKGHY